MKKKLTLKEYQNEPSHKKVDKREAKKRGETLKEYFGSKADNRVDEKRVRKINARRK